MSTMPPIRRQVLVDADPATAFDVFTTRLGRWWPLATHSVHGVHGAGGTVAFAGGQLIEQSAGGERVVWGTVTRWEPQAALAFTWHPGHPEDRASQVEVTFSAAGEQTLVTLTHSGGRRSPIRRRPGPTTTRAGRPCSPPTRSTLCGGTTVTRTPGWRCCTARARPRHRTGQCSMIRCSPSTSRS